MERRAVMTSSVSRFTSSPLFSQLSSAVMASLVPLGKNRIAANEDGRRWNQAPAEHPVKLVDP